jgi:glycosyltransferase involved in cell wall biosynthesis
MKKLEILVMPVGRDGSSFYRATQPYTEIHKQELAGVTLVQPSELESTDFWNAIQKCDWIMVRMSHSDFVINWLDKFVPNKKIILDIDDNIWDVSPYADIYRWHGTQEVKHGDKWLWRDGEDDFNIRRNKRRLARDEALFARANLVTVSTPRLEKLLKVFNPNTKVIYNGINFDNWKPYKMEKDKYFRIGWSGGVSHYVDLIEFKDDLEYLMDKHKNLKFVEAGTHFEGITKNLDQDRVEKIPWVDVEAHPYRSALMNLDLAVIPLAKNSFNECKSCVKWYEFSALGVPTIATNIPPYSDEMPEFSTPNNFREAIEELMNAKARRDKMVEYNLNWVVKNRDIKKIAKELHEHIAKSTPGR